MAVSFGIGCRRSSDPTLLWLWLWCGLAAAAPIQPLAWEPLYATGAALTKDKKKKKKKRKKPPNVLVTFKEAQRKVRQGFRQFLAREERRARFSVPWTSF